MVFALRKQVEQEINKVKDILGESQKQIDDIAKDYLADVEKLSNKISTLESRIKSLEKKVVGLDKVWKPEIEEIKNRLDRLDSSYQQDKDEPTTPSGQIKDWLDTQR